MIFGIECVSNDTVLCGKIIKTINDVGNTISSVVLFNKPITVNVVVEPNCIFGEYKCTIDKANFIGQADSGSRVLLTDELGVERYYQQPLAKQFYENHPRYSDVDIKAKFALRTDYWFQGDPLPAYPSLDFYYIVLHELIHSLGFDTAWGKYFGPDIIVPRPVCAYDNYDGISICDFRKEYKGKVWINFTEYAFDKYLYNLNTLEMLSNKTSYLRKIFDSGLVEGKLRNLGKKFRKSDQFNIAKEVYGLATTNLTIGFLSWNDTLVSDSLVLETNFIPFDDDQSIRHVDSVLYTNTSDFLMRYIYSGQFLQANIDTGGYHADGTLAASIGPKLRRVLETLGYATIDRPYITNVPTISPPRPRLVNSLGHSLSPITLYQSGLLLILVICLVL